MYLLYYLSKKEEAKDLVDISIVNDQNIYQLKLGLIDNPLFYNLNSSCDNEN